MKAKLWLEADVILRYLLRDQADRFRRAAGLFTGRKMAPSSCSFLP
ncbi:MAG: hypothetical protein M0Z27_10670 [Thermaerobacter sp.]|nr:hypothetical protein [Thermaerobacter sp.]